MKFLLSAVFTAVAAAAGTEQALYHLDSMQKLMPPSVELVQIQALMLSKDSIDARDEIATLLFKMQKDIRAEEAAEAKNDMQTQNNCQAQHSKNSLGIKEAEAARKSAESSIANFHSQQVAIPPQVIRLESQIKQIKQGILQHESKIAKAQIARDGESAQFLQNLADFDKALGDIDTLRVLVETGLSNRGQGSDNSVKYTLKPTVKKVVAAPTPINNDRNNTHKAVNPGKFVELSSEEFESMSAEEVKATMKGVYSGLRNDIKHNPTVTSLVQTLDAVFDLDTSHVDKIRALLIQVRNELQKAKRDARAAEQNAVDAWKTAKVGMRNRINDDKIRWQDVYNEKAGKWLAYGNLFQSEGRAMHEKAVAVSKFDRHSITLAFETTICKAAHADYRANSAKRHSQLLQIKKALELLAKMSVKKEEVKKALEGVTAGLCRKFDENSKYKSIVKSSVKIGRRPFTVKPEKMCVSGVKLSYKSSGRAIIVGMGSHTFKLFVDGRRKRFKKEHTEEHKFEPKWFVGERFMARGANPEITGLEVYTVPDCNCHSTFDKDYKVDGTKLQALRDEVAAKDGGR
jgi:hypothetical protein